MQCAFAAAACVGVCVSSPESCYGLKVADVSLLLQPVGRKQPAGKGERRERESARRWTLTTSQLRSQLQSTGAAPGSLHMPVAGWRSRRRPSHCHMPPCLTAPVSPKPVRTHPVPPPPVEREKRHGTLRATVVSSWPLGSVWWWYSNVGSSHCFDSNIEANCLISYSDHFIWWRKSLDIVTSESSNHFIVWVVESLIW